MYVRQLYGSSETGTISANLSADIGESLESVGRPIAGVNIEIYCDERQLTPENEIGEIAVKSEAAIQSYGSEDLDNGTFRDGYFFTGDLGRRDADGLLFLLGRKKLFINKGRLQDQPQRSRGATRKPSSKSRRRSLSASQRLSVIKRLRRCS